MNRDFDLKRISTIVITVFIGSILFFLFASMFKFTEDSSEMQTKSIADIIQKAAIQCYALEGQYPTDIQYLADNYGVILNHEKYIYFYNTSFGDNNVPDITVVPQ